MKHLTVSILFMLIAIGAYAWKPWPLPMDSADHQADTLHYGVALTGSFSGTINQTPNTDLNAPLWLIANTNADLSNAPTNGILSLAAFKKATRPNRWWDYSFGVEFNNRIQTTTDPNAPIISQGSLYTAYFKQLYAHLRLYIFDLTAGIQPFNTTFGDSQLSLGSLLFSNNAHPIPQVSIGIDRWTAFPFTYGYLEIKGRLSHGWITNSRYSTPDPEAFFLHYKYIGARLGGKLPVNISYEFHHAAQWGGKSSIYGNLVNDFSAFKNIFLARMGGAVSIETNNVQGNHLCMQQLAAELRFDAFNISAYWQSLLEDGPVHIIGKTMNRADGLWGLTINQYFLPFIESVTYEFLSTTEQSGPYHDTDGFIFGGRDDYYSHSIYLQGWTYYQHTIGNPLLTPANNRVSAHHFALKGDIRNFYYRLLCTHTTYYTPYTEDLSFNDSQHIDYRRTSLMLEVKKKFPKLYGITFAAALAADIYSNHSANLGGKITISKTFEHKIKSKN